MFQQCCGIPQEEGAGRLVETCLGTSLNSRACSAVAELGFLRVSSAVGEANWPRWAGLWGREGAGWHGRWLFLEKCLCCHRQLWNLFRAFKICWAFDHLCVYYIPGNR